ncbi:MAG: hypothetical protein ACO1N0_16185 [Fluviicola sp.]
MALYQYTLFFIPKVALLGRYGELPVQLEHNAEAWKEYWEQTKDFEDEPEFEDAFSIAWWKGSTIHVDEVLPFAEKFGGVQDWTKNSEGFRKYGESSTHDITVGYHEITRILEDLSCRLDIGQLNESILKTVIEIALTFDCLLMNSKAEVFEADVNELLKRIKDSNAARFMQDPNQFFDDFSSGKVEPE